MAGKQENILENILNYQETVSCIVSLNLHYFILFYFVLFYFKQTKFSLTNIHSLLPYKMWTQPVTKIYMPLKISPSYFHFH